MMKAKRVYLSMVFLVSICLLVPSCTADDRIYINENGVVGSNDIEQEGNVFRFTDNIYKPIFVEIGGIVIDGGWDEGYSLRVGKDENGISIVNTSDVIVRNTKIMDAKNGIRIDNCTDCLIYDNRVTNCLFNGIRVQDDSRRNVIYHNEIGDNSDDSIQLLESSNNVVYENSIFGGEKGGIGIDYSINNFIHNNEIFDIKEEGIGLNRGHNNRIFENTFSDTFIGIDLFRSRSNVFYHNNFMYVRSRHVMMELSTNDWNIEYPGGGNYWFGYDAVDKKRGANQGISDKEGDGFADDPYPLNYDDETNMDLLPLMAPYDPGITCSVNVTLIELGERVEVSGELTPNPGSGIPVVVTVLSKTGSFNLEPVYSSNYGEYHAEFTPDNSGVWVVKAKWVTESTYGGVTSKSVEFDVNVTQVEPEPEPEPEPDPEPEPEPEKPPVIVKKATVLTLSSPKSGYNVNENIVVEGLITPIVIDAEINVEMVDPSGVVTVLGSVKTDSEGRFMVDVMKVGLSTKSGEYQYTVYYDGDEEYKSSSVSGGFQVSLIPGFPIVAIIIGVILMITVKRIGFVQRPTYL